ncbi:hypothetical protein [Phycicoccus sp. Soil748]|uniref:hypothetical protein n=1 Tax=Phycicoccus sp. Soil748 TaxID=1736397 RepID=UPI0012E37615|nr:hypothetical protein [Phycicoccus sp. Soil748]
MANVGLENLLYRLGDRYKGRTADPRLIAKIFHVIDGARQRASIEPKGTCWIAGCEEPAIGSHVIPDSLLRAVGPLTQLVTPDWVNQEISLQPITRSWRQPIFPGYCKRCDDHLFPWEDEGVFGGEYAEPRQLMRAADAAEHEKTLRAEVLREIGEQLHPSSETMANLAPSLKVREIEMLNDASDDLRKTAMELDQFRTHLHDLGQALRLAGGVQSTASAPASHFRVSIGLGDERHDVVQLADAAYIPTNGGVDIRSPVPIAVSVIADSGHWHLLLGTTQEGYGDVARLANHFEDNPKSAQEYAMHWMVWGTHYWFCHQDLINKLDVDEVETLKRNLSLSQFSRVAMWSNTPPERTPIIRPGNGWA